MIRKLFCVAMLGMLTACASTGTRSSTGDSPSASAAAGPGTGGGASSVASSGQGGTCNDDPVQSLVGSKFTQSLAEQARARSGSALVRVVKPGQVMTMEYNPARLNLIVDEHGTLASVHCG